MTSPLTPLVDHEQATRGYGAQSRVAERLSVSRQRLAQALTGDLRLSTLARYLDAWEATGGPPVRVDWRGGALVVELADPARWAELDAIRAGGVDDSP